MSHDRRTWLARAVACVVVVVGGASQMRAADPIMPAGLPIEDEMGVVELVGPPVEINRAERWNELPPLADDVVRTGPSKGGIAGPAVIGGADELVSVLVHLDPQIEAVAATRDLSPARIGLRTFANNYRARIKYEYDILPNVVNMRDVPRKAIDTLKRLPGVVMVEEDAVVHATLNKSVELIQGLQSQITGAGLAATGAGIRVCIVDSGIDSNHIMYTSRIDTAAGYDFANDDSNPEDDNGHGSHVSGIVGGGLLSLTECSVSVPFQGVAPGATLIGVKVLGANGSGLTSDVVAGINHCASAGLPGGPADVINLSLGGGQFSGTCDTDASAQACNNAVNAGVVVVAAAGNNNYSNALSSPACGSQVISVGAVYDDTFPNCEFPSQTSFTFCTAVNIFGQCTATCTDNGPAVDSRVCFSNRSVNLDVSAPGCIIWSADSDSAGSGVVGMCGTSQASPHVAGLAALLLDADPSLTPAEVRQAMIDGSIDLGAAGFDSSFGYGRINVVNSLDLVSGGGCTTNPECDDGVFCNGAETCVASACQAGTAPCSGQLCRESDDTCVDCLSNGDCDDGLFCNGAETCNAAGSCVAGTDPCGGGPCDEGTNSCPGAAQVWLSFNDSASVPGVGTVENEDIVAYDPSSGVWSLVFDGSDVGLSGFTIDGMAVLASGDILLSFSAAGAVGGMTGGPSGSTTLDDSDIVRFVPTSLGATTAGSFVFYFDGSDVGLTQNAENIDAISITGDGRLAISTTGAVSATGASGQDTDLLVFNATSLGATTAGSFAVYFDGSDVGLSDGGNEDVDACGITPSGTFLLSTTGSFAVTGASGADEDLLQFTPTTLGPTTTGTYLLYRDLSALGIATGEDVGSVEWVE